MKNTLKIFGILLMSLVLVTSCEKDDPKPNPNNGGGNGNNNESVISDIFDARDMIDQFEYIDFVSDNEGYAIGRKFGQEFGTYIVFKTTGDNKWEVLNSNLVAPPRDNPTHYFIVNGGIAYYTKVDINNIGIDVSVRLFSIDFETGSTNIIEYDESLINGNTNPPEITKCTFFSPSSQNRNIIAGIASGSGYQGHGLYYVYFVDITTNKIVKMTEIVPVDEYKVFDENNEYNGCNLNPYRANVHLFSDNSFIVGPIAHPECPNNLDYIFMTYDEGTGWSDDALKISAHDGVNVSTHILGATGVGSDKFGNGIFGNKSGDILYYFEYNQIGDDENSILSNSIYKITEKGHSVSKLSLTAQQMNSNYIIMGDSDKGCIVKKSFMGAKIWFTTDGGNTWKLYDKLEEKVISINGFSETSNAYYIASDIAIKGNGIAKAGIIKLNK